ncbi:MAG: glutamate--tRNA ligase family protein [Alphaproteobacteria bacterium]|nr:glutamate--tRNA ligase family protein [Alphaproteobacteria bacterium]
MRNGLSKDLISRILGGVPKYTIAQLEKKFPPRNLPDGAMITRFAPSPTGYFHTGNLYPVIVNRKLAQQSGGIFILRIEDTDTKREVAGSVDILVASMDKFGIKIDEGMVADNKGVGEYGPYTQSYRKDIYHSVAAELLADGRAYPCFLSPEEMEEIRKQQSSDGFSTGIYGGWARDRDLTESEIIVRMNAGGVPSIRLYSTGDKAQKIFCKDVARGSIAFPQNDEDIVIVKSNDGLPTYHFAHLCDDHFMRTTHVVRAEEWLPSLPLHIQLFDMMGWIPPSYTHHTTIDILDSDTGNRRKLSKRKDRVAAIANLWADGWSPEPVLEYVFNLIVSGYEEAKMKNSALTIWDFQVNIKKLPLSGALFDMKKLEWWAKEFIATLSVDELIRRVTNWAKEYSPEWANRIDGQGDYLRSILDIERDDPKRIRKDFITWKQTLEETSYFWDDLFGSAIGNQQSAINKNILSEFLNSFDIKDSKDLWWNKIVEIAARLGIKNGDAAMCLRVTLTGRTNTPDLYSIIQVMGEHRVKERVKSGIGI